MWRSNRQLTVLTSFFIRESKRYIVSALDSLIDLAMVYVLEQCTDLI